MIVSSRQNLNRRGNEGFTLVELMVSVSIFAIVTLITSGSFIVLADIYRKTQTNRAVIDNLNLAMDTMTLQIREGKNYDDDGNKFTFDSYIVNADGDYVLDKTISYELDEERGVLEECVGGECSDLTSDNEIFIDRLEFIRANETPTKVTIVVDGTATNKEGRQTEFLLQTTLSQRNK